MKIKSLIICIIATITCVFTINAQSKFELPQLGYAYDALEPVIDAQTMQIHHSKHHQAYVNNLNKALEGTAVENLSIEEIIKNISKYSTAVRNNAGGHYNHSFFWTILTPNKNKQPSNSKNNTPSYILNSLEVPN